MTDPVTRAAKRQNLVDRLAEHLASWGCPNDLAPERARQLLLEVEAHGWTLPTIAAPPLTGRGSTPEGRARARRALEQVLAGCRCGSDIPGQAPAEHPVGCPIRYAHDAAAAAVDGTRL
jgi:hypothetical protein